MYNIINVAFLCLVGASLTRGYLDEAHLDGDFKELVETIQKTCVEQTGATNAEIMNTNEGQFPDDPKLKCYMKCVLAEGGAMDKDGKFDFSLVEELLPEPLRKPVDNMFQECIPKATNSDMCERAFEFFKCCYSVDSKNYFLL